jgi:hypothetical protein
MEMATVDARDGGREAPAASAVIDAPLADPRAEVVRVLEAAEVAGVTLRAVGGLAVFLRCPSARRPPLARDYKDIDLVGRAGGAPAIGSLLESTGYVPDREFNAIHGHQRLFFWDPVNERQLDVFISNIVMCHALRVEEALVDEPKTLPLADLLLSKLQVVETNEKDLRDAAAILADHELAAEGIDPARILTILCTDWGWWRTATETLRKIDAYAASLEGLDRQRDIRERVVELLASVDAAPKSLRWKLRARVGERVRWYELPEEV